MENDLEKGQKGFKKGDKDAGSKDGMSNFTKNKPWKDAIKRAVLARDGNALRSLSEALIDKALTGDVSALREVGDRLDGKAVQEIEASEDKQLTIKIVKFADLPD